MPTMGRKEFDEELARWLAGVQAEQNAAQSVEEIDQLSDLWLTNGEAAAIKDPTSPAAEAVHERINGLLDGMGL